MSLKTKTACVLVTAATLSSVWEASLSAPLLACEQDGALEMARQVKARHEAALLAVPGVVGAGIGRGTAPGEMVIEVYVASPAEDLRLHLPTELEGIRVQLVETGEFTPRQSP